MKALQKAAAARLAELRSRMIVRLVNRSCRVQPNVIDRIALQAIEKLVGPAGQPDPDLEHPDI
jgi:hypothetical protein